MKKNLIFMAFAIAVCVLMSCLTSCSSSTDDMIEDMESVSSNKNAKGGLGYSMTTGCDCSDMLENAVVIKKAWNEENQDTFEGLIIKYGINWEDYGFTEWDFEEQFSANIYVNGHYITTEEDLTGDFTYPTWYDMYGMPIKTISIELLHNGHYIYTRTIEMPLNNLYLSDIIGMWKSDDGSKVMSFTEPTADDINILFRFARPNSIKPSIQTNYNMEYNSTENCWHFNVRSYEFEITEYENGWAMTFKNEQYFKQGFNYGSIADDDTSTGIRNITM